MCFFVFIFVFIFVVFRTLWTLIYASFFLFSVSSAYLWIKYQRDLRLRVASIGAAFLATILLFLLLRFAIISIYDWLIKRKRARIQLYVERKMAIIEDVKENEKFKVAKDIIEKYSTKEELLNSGKQFFGSFNFQSNANFAEKSLSSGNLAQNNDGGGGGDIDVDGATPATNFSASAPSAIRDRVPKLNEIRDRRYLRTPVRPFVEQSQTPIDKILDYVIGENISNR